MKKFNANDKVRFAIYTTRASEKFHLNWNGQLTVTESTTSNELKESLLIDFLAEVNEPRNKREQYKPNEIQIILTLA